LDLDQYHIAADGAGQVTSARISSEGKRGAVTHLLGRVDWQKLYFVDRFD
jgi:hypothetical protein